MKGTCTLLREHVPVREHCHLILLVKTDSKRTVSELSLSFYKKDTESANYPPSPRNSVMLQCYKIRQEK